MHFSTASSNLFVGLISFIYTLYGPYRHIKVDIHSLLYVFRTIKVPLIANQQWFTSIYIAHQGPQWGLDKLPCVQISPRSHHNAWDVSEEPK